MITVKNSFASNTVSQVLLVILSRTAL